MTLKNVRELIKKTREYVKSPIALQLVDDFESFIELKHQTKVKDFDYPLRLEEARVKFMHSAKAMVENFGISKEALEANLKDVLASTPEKEALKRALITEEGPKKSRKSKKTKSTRV
jgi:hypothetical protein